MHPTGCHWTKQIIFNRCERRCWMVLMNLGNDVSSYFFDIRLHCGKLDISQIYHSRMVLTTQLRVYLRLGRGHDGDSSLVCTRICTVYRFYRIWIDVTQNPLKRLMPRKQASQGAICSNSLSKACGNPIRIVRNDKPILSKFIQSPFYHLLPSGKLT